MHIEKMKKHLELRRQHLKLKQVFKNCKTDIIYFIEIRIIFKINMIDFLTLHEKQPLVMINRYL